MTIFYKEGELPKLSTTTKQPSVFSENLRFEIILLNLHTSNELKKHNLVLNST